MQSCMSLQPVLSVGAKPGACMCRDYWASVPAVYRPRMHFYNTPITPDFADASHPLNIIRAMYRPGTLPSLLCVDHVVGPCQGFHEYYPCMLTR